MYKSFTQRNGRNWPNFARVLLKVSSDSLVHSQSTIHKNIISGAKLAKRMMSLKLACLNLKLQVTAVKVSEIGTNVGHQWHHSLCPQITIRLMKQQFTSQFYSSNYSLESFYAIYFKFYFDKDIISATRFKERQVVSVLPKRDLKFCNGCKCYRNSCYKPENTSLINPHFWSIGVFEF